MTLVLLSFVCFSLKFSRGRYWVSCAYRFCEFAGRRRSPVALEPGGAAPGWRAPSACRPPFRTAAPTWAGAPATWPSSPEAGSCCWCSGPSGLGAGPGWAGAREGEVGLFTKKKKKKKKHCNYPPASGSEQKELREKSQINGTVFSATVPPFFFSSKK